MLGKGLESLIPPGGGQKPNDDGAISQTQEEKEEGEILSSPGVIASEPQGGTRAFPGKERRFEKKPSESIFQIEVEKIKPNPHQPRKDFDEESIRELAASISEVGILQPLVVTKFEKETPTGTDVEYVLIAGERRLLAAKMLGLTRVPAIIKRLDFERERLTMAIIENLQREGLNPIETARAFARLQDEFNLTQREIATRLGKSREAVANSVRLLDLPAYIQEALAQRQISETHGRLLLVVQDPAAQKKLFDDIVEKKLTTRELEGRVKPEKKETLAARLLSPELVMAEQELASRLGAPVRIEQKGKKGKILINFYSEEELRSILERLGRKDQ